ncbi:MAG: LiaI-LiaF-like domain-containing protein [Marinifilaceae bacterium]|jgi:hypothetical protein
MERKQHEKSLFWGILLIAAGGLLVLSNLNIWPYNLEHYLFRWESFVILIGLLLLIVRKQVVGGLFMMAVGGYFLLDDLYFFPCDWQKWFWPVLLLIGGGAMILNRNRYCK